MKLYTKQGDDGKTNLSCGPRVTKDDPHVEACGTVDELNALIGLTRCESLPPDVDSLLHRIQHELFGVGADLAMPAAASGDMALTDDRHVERLEQEIDALDAQVPPLQQFILPGGVRGAALLHVARTVCRRAERRVVALEFSRGDGDIQAPIVRYLNRLGDLLFVLPRVLNSRSRVEDEGWRKGHSG